MVASLPQELKGKLTLALLKDLQQDHGAGDGNLHLRQAKGGHPAKVHVGSLPSTVPLSHTEAQTLATNAHLTGGQLKSVMADFRSHFGQGIVEAGLSEAIPIQNSRFSPYFKVEKKLFMNKNNEPLVKPLFYCHRIVEFLHLVA